jgi:hypothetical protein
MAMMSDMEKLIGMAILDGGFRAKFLADPAAAAKDVCVELTDLQVSRIQSMDPKLLDWWAQGLDKIRGEAQGFLW